MQAAELFWSSIITIRSLAGSLLHGDRSGLARRARTIGDANGALDQGCFLQAAVSLQQSI